MTYAPQAPAPRQRPRSVTLAAGLMFALVVLLLVSAVIAFVVNTPEVQRAMDNLTSVSGGGSSNPVQKYAPIVSAVISLVFAVVILTLALGNLRGNNGTRIATWVLGGLGVVCCGLGSVFSFALTGLASRNMQGDQKAAYQRLLDAYPSWYRPASAVIAVLEILCLIGIIVFLAVPASNAFFRKPVQEWVPPAPTA